MAFTVVYDADVLHPPSVRDLLLRLAVTGLFQARWSEQILDEMVDSIIRQRPELAARLARTRALMCDAVQDCVVAGYKDLIDGLVLPDPTIVTNNIRDFPADTLAPTASRRRPPTSSSSTSANSRPPRCGQAASNPHTSPWLPLIPTEPTNTRRSSRC